MRNLILSALLAGWNLAGAQSAILTLTLPPPGGDGYSALQSGGAFPTGATSLYYNPALLAELERSTGSQFHATYSHQEWPAFFTGVNQTYTGAAASFPSRTDGFDLGIGVFRNHLEYGPLLLTDTNGTEISRYNAYESVYGLGVALRLGLPVSLGGSVKYYDSRFGRSENSQARGWAFDLGIATNPHLYPLIPVGIASVEVNPSAGLAVQNMGPEVWYSDPDLSDPLPRTLRSSVGLETSFADLVEAAAGYDLEKEWHRNHDFFEDFGVSNYGVSFSIAGFRYGWAWLKYPETETEEYEAYQYEFNSLQVYRIWQRLRQRDFLASSESMEVGFPFKKIQILGLDYKPNPRFVIGKRRYESQGDFRESQKAWFWSFSP